MGKKQGEEPATKPRSTYNGAQNLRRAPRRKKPASRTSCALRTFCSVYYLNNENLAGTAQAMERSTQWADRMRKRPLFKEIYAEVAKQQQQRIDEKLADKAILTVEFVDSVFFEQLKQYVPNERLGLIDLAKVGETLYRRYGKIQPIRVTQQTANINTPAGQTMYGQFKAGWRIRKDLEMAARAEKEDRQLTDGNLPNN